MTNCHDVDGDGDKEKGIVEILNEAYTDGRNENSLIRCFARRI